MSLSLSRPANLGQCGPDSGSVSATTPRAARRAAGPAWHSVPVTRVPGWIRTQICWLVPAVTAAFVVTYRAADPAPWRDEFATWSVATRTVGQIFALGRHIDGVLVPYYLFLHAWIGWA